MTTTTTSGSSKKDGKAGAGGADKRGNYKCGRCGQPKKGHVCTNKPRLRTACKKEATSSLPPLPGSSRSRRSSSSSSSLTGSRCRLCVCV